MGLTVWECDQCGEQNCDTGLYWTCEECGSRLCDECTLKYNANNDWLNNEDYEDEEDQENEDEDLLSGTLLCPALAGIGCPFCRKEICTDYDLLEFALEELGISREELEIRYRNL